MLRKVILSLCIILLPVTAFSEEVNLEGIINGIKETGAFERAGQTTKKGNEILDRDLGAMEERLCHIPDIEKKIVQDKMGAIATQKEQPDTIESPIFRPEERIFIFVSETVPVELLRTYTEAVKSIGRDHARVVFRGIPGKQLLGRLGSKEPKRQSNCPDNGKSDSVKILVSERLFNAYGIRSVPAILYDPTGIDPGKDYLLIYGAGALEEAFRLFHSRTGNEAFKVSISRFEQN